MAVTTNGSVSSETLGKDDQAKVSESNPETGSKFEKKSPEKSIANGQPKDPAAKDEAKPNEVEKARKLLKEPNLDDGTDVDDLYEAIEHRNLHYNKDVSEWMEMRKEIMPKRAKQHRQYQNIMEARVVVLEDRILELEKLLGTNLDQIKNGLKAKKTDILFSLNPLLWSDFKSPPEKGPKHVIDVLVEEPQYSANDKSKSQLFIDLLTAEDRGLGPIDSPKIPVQDRALETQKAVESLKGKRMPERIRFNSIALQHVLRKQFTPGSTEDEPFSTPGVVMLRPYKSLFYFEEEIRQKQDELFNALEVFGSSGSSDSKDVSAQASSGSASPPDAPSGCNRDPNLPLRIDKEGWTSILKKLDLFYSDKLVESIVKEWPTDVEVRKSFECLSELMDVYLRPVSLLLRKREKKQVRFCDLWHLFRSGDEIVMGHASGPENVLAMRILRTGNGRRYIHPGKAPSFDSTPLPKPEDQIQPVNRMNPFVVHAWFIDFSGSAFTPVRRRIIIQPYTQERNITDLEAYPIEYADNPENLKRSLIERGRKFVKLAKPTSSSYCDCNGEDLATKEELSDKVIVDMKEYCKVEKLPGYTEPEALDMSETSNCPHGLICEAGPHCGLITNKILHDQHIDKHSMKEHVETQPVFQRLTGIHSQKNLELDNEDDYMLCNHRIFAYKLRSRDWVKVHVQSLTTASKMKEDKGFKRLVLPGAHRHIIESQVREHFRKKSLRSSTTHDGLDLVRGKGQGLIILLHGAPGVGKTATAETISELVHKPLYPITCGDLGSTATEVEESLKKHFTLASRWDCVMLLDEADVFLAQRTSEDLQRNSIVSVFLRTLEYYKGLLFLTTNRVGTFDEAFKSRVHISLYYPDFDRKTTVKVWKTFLKQTKETIEDRKWKHYSIKDNDIMEFAGKHWENNPLARWNGRQIRNAFHTAVAMAEFDARDKDSKTENPRIILSSKQFEKIASTVEDFDRYMYHTVGATYEEKANKSKIRSSKAEAKQNTNRERKDRYSEAESTDEEIYSNSDSDSDSDRRKKSRKDDKKKVKKGKKGKKSRRPPSDDSSSVSQDDLDDSSDDEKQRKKKSSNKEGTDKKDKKGKSRKGQGKDDKKEKQSVKTKESDKDSESNQSAEDSGTD